MKLMPTLTPEQRRQTAYHEAGHVLVLWMYGQYGDLRKIDMRPNFSRIAVVNAKGEAFLPCTLPQTSRAVLFCLAGACAANRVVSNIPDWLDWELNEWEADGSDPGHDMGKAIAVTGTLYGNSKRAETFVRRCAMWTDELMTHPRCWRVVEALALGVF